MTLVGLEMPEDYHDVFQLFLISRLIDGNADVVVIDHPEIQLPRIRGEL